MVLRELALLASFTNADHNEVLKEIGPFAALLKIIFSSPLKLYPELTRLFYKWINLMTRGK